MKSRFRLKSIAIILAAILGLAVFVMLASPSDQTPTFDTQSLDPGGTAAFVVWLRKLGYQVQVEGIDSIPVKPGELEIVMTPLSEDADTKNINESLLSSIRSSGGNLLKMFFDSGTFNSTKVDPPIAVKALGTNRIFQVDTSAEFFTRSRGTTSNYAVATAADDPTSALSTIRSLKAGSDAIESWTLADLATNAYLGRADNGAFLNYLISRLSPTKTIVINRQFTRTDQPSIFEFLGPWAQQGWNQTLILFAVIALTVSARFGVSGMSRFHQTSSRSFADVIALAIKSTRGIESATNRIYGTLEKRIRNHYGVPSVANITTRNEAIPSELSTALTRVEFLLGQRPKDQELLAAIQDLEAIFNRLGIKPKAFPPKSRRQ